MNKRKKTNWNIPVPKTLDDALEEAITKDTHPTKSDFVRDAVRRKLEELGFEQEVIFYKNQKVRINAAK